MKRSKRKNSVKYLVASTIIVIGIFILFQELRNKPTKNEEEVVAKVNGEVILKSELEKKIRNFVNMGFDQIEIPQIESMPKEVLEVIIKDIYFERSVVKEALKLGLDKNLEINEKLQEYKKKLLTQEYLKVSTEKEISDEAVNNKYAELTNKLEGKKEYRISHILVKNKENIEIIYNCFVEDLYHHTLLYKLFVYLVYRGTIHHQFDTMVLVFLSHYRERDII